MNLLEALNDPAVKWYRVPPADAVSIQKLASESGISLPASYLAFLAYSNGGDGPLAIEPGWFDIWPAEEVIERNQRLEIDKDLPGFFGFGSNGAGELLALDMREGPPWRIGMIPFIPMQEEYAVIIADSFDAFVRAMGRPLPGPEGYVSREG